MNKIYKVEIITRPELFDDLKEALGRIEIFIEELRAGK